MKSKVKFSKPEVTGISVTMTVDEAELLKKFLGPTKISHVRDLLPDSNENVHYEINDMLYRLFNALGDAIDEATI